MKYMLDCFINIISVISTSMSLLSHLHLGVNLHFCSCSELALIARSSVLSNFHNIGLIATDRLLSVHL